MPTSNLAPIEQDAVVRERRSFRRALSNRLIYSLGKDPMTATARDWFYATAYATRDRLIERWIDTMRRYDRSDAKRVYYLSMEFLTGRLLSNSLLNLGHYEHCREALAQMELDFEEVCRVEPDAALGNGGLGRLAACFLDSLATLSLPGYGYGIRYEYGMFTQRIENGWQVEYPDNWLKDGNPWEFPRPEVLFPVRFGGHVVQVVDELGKPRFHWIDTDEVVAMAYDTPVPGFDTDTVNNMRLWAARASHDFNLKSFNEGNYLKSVQAKTESENLSKVLYPDDSTPSGRALRLKQQYFFVSASLQDILQRFHAVHPDLTLFPEKVAIQLNDTHPSIAIAELMRIFLDQYGLEWEQAWDLTRRTFAYTNHTLMPEALESWPVSLFETLLPRHLQIIYEINYRFLEHVRYTYPGDVDRLRRMSIVDEAPADRRLRMAHLAIVGSHRVNGVSAIHTELMKERVFGDFHAFMPDRIINITNGITPRRWLNQANPALAALISDAIGAEWVTDLSELKKLEVFADHEGFKYKFRDIKRVNKQRLAGLIKASVNVTVDPMSLFDVQVKRFHEYKRQLLNVLHVVTRYNRLRDGETSLVPRTIIFSGKAAPGYWMAKLVIRLIHGVADVVNNDPAIGDRLKVVFLPDYSVSNAERIIPASDLSQQISTAGTEASGTGNMKLALNGALTIGTLDGANVEMMIEVGEENMFIFGLTDEQIAARRTEYKPWDLYHRDASLRRVLDMIGSGFFSADQPDRFKPIVDALTGGDRYFLLADYRSYVDCQDRVDAVFRTPDEWTRRAILNVAGMGRFSSDRTTREYAERIWGVNVEPNERPDAV